MKPRAWNALGAAWTISSLITGCLSSSPPIKVSLQSSWPAPPFLLELIETISIEEPNAFFPLLETLTDPQRDPRPETLSREALEQLALQAALSAGFLSKPGSLELAQMQLALHAATPKIEAFFSYYTNAARERAAHMDEKSCESWVDWYGEVVCDGDRLAELAGRETIDQVEGRDFDLHAFQQPKLLSFDHIHPSPTRTPSAPRTAILHASLTSSNFRDLHTQLLRLANTKSPKVQYVFRPIPSSSSSGESTVRTQLSGYGVKLDLKKMDYLALDDRLSGHAGMDDLGGEAALDLENATYVDPVLSVLEHYPVNETLNLAEPLSEAELMRLGIQATQLVMEAQDPFATLKRLSQDFPRYASSISRRVVADPNITEEVTKNSMKTQTGLSLAWLNGAIVPEDKMNPFNLLKLVRQERDIMLSLTAPPMSLEPPTALELLTHPAIEASYTGNHVLDGIFDASDRSEGGGLINWWNDLEKDSRYERWPTSIYALIRPSYGGQLPSARLNTINIVSALDLSRASSLHFLVSTVSSLINRNLPIRFGFAPLVEGEEGIRMFKIISYLISNYGRGKTMTYMRTILDSPGHGADMAGKIDLTRAELAFHHVIANEEPLPDGVASSYSTVVDDTGEPVVALLAKARAYAKRLDLAIVSSSMGHVFINGRYYTLDDTFLSNLQTDLGKFMQYFQEHLYEGSLTDDNIGDVSVYFYDLPTSYKKRNRHVIPSGPPSETRIFSLPAIFDNTGFSLSHTAFVYPEVERAPSTLFIVADLDTEDGLGLVQFALTFLASPDARSRLSFIHNPLKADDVPEPGTRVSSLMAHLITNGLLQKASPSHILRALGLHVAAGDEDQTILSPKASLADLMGGTTLDNINPEVYKQYVEAGGLIAQRLGLRPGNSAILINGRVVGPFLGGEFLVDDFSLLEGYEFAKRIEPTLQALQAVMPSVTDLDSASFSHLVMTLSSIIADIRTPDPSDVGLFNQNVASRSRNYRRLASEFTKFEMGNETEALLHFAVLLDPLSEAAQKYTSILEWLSSLPHVHIEFHILPAPYHELPLKRFYRYNLLPKLAYDDSGDEIAPIVAFEDLPMEPIYTLGLDEPSPWLVRPRVALYDLDNIQLGVLSGKERQEGLEAIYQLDYLIVDGHAREGSTITPPRGVQLQLTSGGSQALDDTLVVANLGYLQFKATPGIYRLEIREGRGRDIYRIESAGNDGWDSPSVEEIGDEITVTSFEGLTLYPRLTRLPGMEHADVLEEPASAKPEENVVQQLLSQVSSFFKPVPEPELSLSAQKHAEINIFTVASGLLYERFASIMILSVLRNTKHTVKFWFIENFLSPSFLEFIPHFAEEYGFKYELVTYKWPTWLRHQTEKQRIIWAYKILFLDVLFPMDLDKVIFVDADQIVRADLKELVDLDLHGAPYGYTPMGDDNLDMEGFRFWKTGYWENFLKGRPYHISALYVVDLVRFRQMTAGDILRSHYQQLSADPNSLANLDQDLPNNLQNYVPIYSLHEDWLWCETWCSKDRLPRAKTIDLCQNPLTKEPKLSRARQIPEWEHYDAEIVRFTRKLADEGRIRASAAAADVNELANVASGKAEDTNDRSEDGDEHEEHKRDEL
ncbi:UDP-glucose:glycoprotein glucosyltransferase-domain-containing protein [Amylostereum chailletii]|nr:UDP-glucose:glycoprotein glucosyltransferase-domain-containing protein [Amylostereum chailletii]